MTAWTNRGLAFNFSQNCSELVQDLFIGEAQDAILLAPELISPRQIARQSFSMTITIRFNDEFGDRAIEVKDEGPNWMLAPKPESTQSTR